MIEILKRMETRLQQKEMLERLPVLAQSVPRVDAKGKGKAKEGINHITEPFDWSEGLKARMKAVLRVSVSAKRCEKLSSLPPKSFLFFNRVCNANMDGHDIVCIMPTSSLLILGPWRLYLLRNDFQVAVNRLLVPTLIISPLISLMTDQILHLREANSQYPDFCSCDFYSRSRDDYWKHRKKQTYYVGCMN
jgi:hypothetical protein